MPWSVLKMLTIKPKVKLNSRVATLLTRRAYLRLLRDASRKRLSDTLGQAKLRLGSLQFAEEASAAHLETECFKKYQKVGKTFYNSQIAATVRWLSSSSSEQIHDRLKALTNQSTEHGAAASSSPCIIPHALGEAEKLAEANVSHEFAKTEPSDEFAKTTASTENMELPRIPPSGKSIAEEGTRDLAISTMNLPKIPSFKEFMSQKGRDHTTSSSRAESQPRGVHRKASPAISREGTTGTSKKMKL